MSPSYAPVVLKLEDLTCNLEFKVATSQESGNVELCLTDGNRKVVVVHGTEVDSHTTMSAYALLKAVTGFVQQLHLHDQPGARIVDPSLQE